MKGKVPVKQFAIIADDLTGAMDTGVGFARIGLNTIITFGNEIPSEAAAVVVSTDSRADSPEMAYRKTEKEAGKLAGLYVYKKIDSTLRGNIGSELMALVDTLHIEKVIVCPAFPGNKRTVLNGELLVENIPVNKTHFSRDPFCPVTEAHIPTLLHEQAGFRTGSIGLEEVEKGPAHIAQQISSSQQRVIVVDAVEQVHLRYIAEALIVGGKSWLPCGSAGLAGELPFAFGHKARNVRPADPSASGKPVLLVIGSRNDSTARQLRKAKSCLHIPLVSIEPDEFVSRKGRVARINQIAKQAGDLIDSAQSIAITSTLSRYTPALKQSTSGILTAIASSVMRRRDIAGLILSGGDIARAACAALEAVGIRILKELQPGIVVGEIIGGTKEGMKSITKAGGFGNDDALIEAIYYLKGEKKGETEE